MYGVYTKETADAIYQWYKSQVRNVGDNPSKANWVDTWYFVKLVEDLNAATDPETGYTQALANAIKYTNSDDSLDRSELTTEELQITVTNRSTSFSGKEGDYLWVVKPHDLAEFIPLVPAGGGDYFWFTVNSLVCPGEDEINFPDGGLIVTATYSPTGTFPRGREDDGTYFVYDYMGILDYSIDAVDNINGSKGRCSWGAEIGTTDFMWILDSIMVNPSCA